MATETTKMRRVINENMEEKQDEALVRMPDLPLDIIKDILSRLSVKILIRFRCVSKHWRSLLSTDSSFIEKHLSRALQNGGNNSLILHNRSENNFFSIPNGIFEKVVKLDYSPKTSGPPFHMVGSSNGLICLYELAISKRKVIHIWNPATREYMPLPSPSIQRKKVINVALGFEFLSVIKDYKVVRLVMFKKGGTYGCSRVEAEIYSMKTKSWRKLGVFSYYVYGTGSEANLNGVVHWLADHGSRPVYSSYHEFILSFNMADEEFQEVRFPGNMYQEGVANILMYLQTFRGCLSLYSTKARSDDLDLWVMKEYNVKESWVKLFTIETCSEYIRPMTFLGNGNILLFHVPPDCLLVCSSECDNFKKLQFPENFKKLQLPELGCPWFMDFMQSVESLVPVLAGCNQAKHQHASGLGSQKKRTVEEREESGRKRLTSQL